MSLKVDTLASAGNAAHPAPAARRASAVAASALPEEVPDTTTEVDLLSDARRMFAQQAQAIAEIGVRLDDEFCRAVELVLGCQGRLVVSGIGKSGLVGRKMAATFSSTGTPALFLHPSEASHGDLGVVQPGDVVLLVSYSGESEEVMRLMPYFKQVGVSLIAMVGNRASTLAEQADVVLDIAVRREVCPLNLAPTTSALVTLAMGDALALSIMSARGIGPVDFARFHPGGALGRRLVTRVADVMQKRDLPFVAPGQTVQESLLTMTRGRCGIAIVVDREQRLRGIVTDGDLRRGLQRDPEFLQRPIVEAMTPNPVTIHEDATVAEAEERMQRLRLKVLIVIAAKGRAVGIIEIFKS